ncbi:MAG: manganese efflux pump [Saprospiraceae bacterium]|nr:manganese efflux pump [Saprospiraceae bacterium]
MALIFILGILVGLDNLQISSAIGMMGLKKERRWLVTLLFVLFEVSMPLIGLLIGHKLNSSFEHIAEWIGASILISLGAYILISEWLEKEEEDIINKKLVLILLPFIMSLDNLVVGVGLGTSGYPILSTSIIVGLCAGTMCFLGLLIGDKLRNINWWKIELVSGFYLIGLGIYSII